MGDGGRFRRLLRENREFRLLWLAQTTSRVGDNFGWLALALVATRVGQAYPGLGPAGATALVIGSLTAPNAVFGLFGGALADRLDRKVMMVTADVVRGVMALVFIPLALTGNLVGLCLVAIVFATAGAAFNPARQSSIPNIVKREDLLTANSLAQITEVASMMLGPALAGTLIEAYGEGPALAVDAATFLVSAILILAVHLPHRITTTTLTVRAILVDTRRGLRFIRGGRIVRAILACQAVVMLGVGAINILWVPFMREVLGIGPSGIGFIDTSQAVGMAAGGLLTGLFVRALGYQRTIVLALMIAGALVAAIGAVSNSLAVVMSFTLLLGVAIPPIQASLATLMQVNVPDHVRGRVESASNVTVNTGLLISMAAAGALAGAIGERQTFMAAGALVLGSGLVASLSLGGADRSVSQEPAIEDIAGQQSL